MTKIYSDKQKIAQYLDLKGEKKSDFYKKTGFSNGFLDSGSSLSVQNLRIILDKYQEINPDWLITGEGSMLKSEKQEPTSRHLIPFYSDVASIGGSAIATNKQTNEQVEYIDAGDWFPNATAAIRHYGDSMVEYPSGCILALKDVVDLVNGFVLGQNYVVEYGEDWNRVTKRIQRNGSKFMAYSTNEETYKDGTLIHQPFELVNIHHAWRVLGYVVKSESSRGVINVGLK